MANNNNSFVYSMNNHRGNTIKLKKLNCEHRKMTLQYDLVFEASIEVFVWQDDRVEYDDLGRDVYITTCEESKSSTVF